MQRLLCDLAAEGRTESSGRFSLDSALAVRKLALFQKAEPSQFLALLVQAAVMSGAPAVHLRFGGRGGGCPRIQRAWSDTSSALTVVEEMALAVRVGANHPVPRARRTATRASSWLLLERLGPA